MFHQPVLLDEVIENLGRPDTKAIIDGTLGLGGHAEAFLHHCPQLEKYLGSDLDEEHLHFSRNRLKKFSAKIQLENVNFSELLQSVNHQKIPRPLSILLDLGLCSNQIDTAEKGFSFLVDGPLKMSFSGVVDRNAEWLVNTFSMHDLAKIFREYGEEKNAIKIAKNIEKYREKEMIKTTEKLREIIEEVTIAPNRKKTNTRVFQAIRIAVNDELSHLQKALESFVQLMQSGDRFGVISYHSLEARLVKQFFREKTTPITKATNFSLHTVVAEAEFFTPTKKPITPTETEIANNNRSRSAEFRIIIKK